MAVCFQLTVVRHGETDANKDKIIQGQQDTAHPLSQLGRRQVEQLAGKLSQETISTIYSSDLLRTRETSEVLSSQLKTPVEVDHRLRERSFGSLEGQSLSELVKSARGRGVGVVEYTPPGGESLDEVEARTVEFFCDLCRKYSHLANPATPIAQIEGSIFSRYCQSKQLPALSAQHPTAHALVVSHGGLIRCLLNHLKAQYQCQLPERPLSTPNTAVNSFLVVMETEPEPKCVSVTVLCLHDTSHLK